MSRFLVFFIFVIVWLILDIAFIYTDLGSAGVDGFTTMMFGGGGMLTLHWWANK